jgi:hypothetical protein
MKQEVQYIYINLPECWNGNAEFNVTDVTRGLQDRKGKAISSRMILIVKIGVVLGRLRIQRLDTDSRLG